MNIFIIGIVCDDNSKKDYFILTTRTKSDIMEFVTNEWIDRGFKIYKMVTFERLTKTKYIINNNFSFLTFMMITSLIQSFIWERNLKIQSTI